MTTFGRFNALQQTSIGLFVGAKVMSITAPILAFSSFHKFAWTSLSCSAALLITAVIVGIKGSKDE